MNLQNLQDAITARIREIKLLAGLPVLAEDKGNIIEDLQAEIAKTSFAVVVGGCRFTDTKPNSSLAIGSITITVSIFENPTFNRAAAKHVTLTEAAQAVVKELKLFNTGDGLLTNPTIGDIQDLGEGVISTACNFELQHVTL